MTGCTPAVIKILISLKKESLEEGAIHFRNQRLLNFLQSVVKTIIFLYTKHFRPLAQQSTLGQQVPSGNRQRPQQM